MALVGQYKELQRLIGAALVLGNLNTVKKVQFCRKFKSKLIVHANILAD